MKPVTTISGQTESTGTIDRYWGKSILALASKIQPGPLETME